MNLDIFSNIFCRFIELGNMIKKYDEVTEIWNDTNIGEIEKAINEKLKPLNATIETVDLNTLKCVIEKDNELFALFDEYVARIFGIVMAIKIDTRLLNKQSKDNFKDNIVNKSERNFESHIEKKSKTNSKSSNIAGNTKPKKPGLKELIEYINDDPDYEYVYDEVSDKLKKTRICLDDRFDNMVIKKTVKNKWSKKLIDLFTDTKTGKFLKDAYDLFVWDFKRFVYNEIIFAIDDENYDGLDEDAYEFATSNNIDLGEEYKEHEDDFNEYSFDESALDILRYHEDDVWEDFLWWDFLKRVEEEFSETNGIKNDEFNADEFFYEELENYFYNVDNFADNNSFDDSSDDIVI